MANSGTRTNRVHILVDDLILVSDGLLLAGRTALRAARTLGLLRAGLLVHRLRIAAGLLERRLRLLTGLAGLLVDGAVHRLVERGAVLGSMRVAVAGLVMRRLVRSRLMHGRLVMRRLMVRRGLRAGLVMRRLVIRRMVRPGRRSRLEVVMLGRRRRCRAIVMPVRRRGRRSYVMHDRGIIIDQIDVFGRDDATDEGKGHHTGDAGGDEAHRASFYKVVAFVSLS